MEKISTNSINDRSNVSLLPAQKINEDNISLFSNTNNKIEQNEIVPLIIQGAANEVKDVWNAYCENPLESTALIGATILAVALAGRCGVSIQTSSRVLFGLFMGISSSKLAYNSVQAYQNNKDGNYDEARENIKDIGGNVLELSLQAIPGPTAEKIRKELNKYLFLDGNAARNIFVSIAESCNMDDINDIMKSYKNSKVYLDSRISDSSTYGIYA